MFYLFVLVEGESGLAAYVLFFLVLFFFRPNFTVSLIISVTLAGVTAEMRARLRRAA